MSTDYEEFYRGNRHGLGEPRKKFVEFFDMHNQGGLTVLDVGCGQGRDALFVARLGHNVTAIDLSPLGIDDLRTDAAAEDLTIAAEVADIRDYRTKRLFDIILINRTLHILAPEERAVVLQKLLDLSTRGTHVLIADERSNMPDFKAALSASMLNWRTTLEQGGFLFIQREWSNWANHNPKKGVPSMELQGSVV